MSFHLYKTCYYDEIQQIYNHIITVHTIPEGLLSIYIKNVSITNICTYAIKNTILSNYIFKSNIDLCTIENLPDLVTWLLNNGYTVDKCITLKIDNSPVLICKKLD